VVILPPITTPESPLPAEGDFLLPVCISAETLAWLLAQVTHYSRQDAHKALTARYAILEAMAFVNNPAGAACAAGLEGAGMKLRQSTENPCILQQEQGADNWIDVFDYSLCAPLSEADIINLTEIYHEGLGILNILIELYDGTAESIDEDIEYGVGNDEELDRAMCAALSLLVNALLDTELERRRRNLGIARVAGLTLSIVSIIAGFFTAGTAWIVKGAALGGAGTLFGALLGELDTAALEDTEARNDVICCIYDALNGATPQRGLFISAAENCAATLTGNAGQIANVIYNVSTDLSTFVGFIHYMARLSQTPEVALYLCECEENDPWCWEYDFHLDDYNWQAVPGRGQYTTPWTAEPSPAANRLVVYAESSTPVWITAVHLEYFLGGPLANGNVRLFRGGRTGTLLANRETWKGPTGNHQNTFNFNPALLADTVQITFEMTGDFGPRHELNLVRLHGVGLPFTVFGVDCT
jgi:hypothetical protein